MTTLALLPESLRRLFARVDAAGASEPSLELALNHWRIRRAGKLFPGLSEIAPEELGPLASHVFIFERRGKAEWRLRYAGEAAKKLLAPSEGDATLSRLENRRIAERLKLLIQWVQRTGEAVSATFVLHDETGEILVAPLSSDGKTVEGAFGGIVARHAVA